jgi:hypothetical protein
MTAILSSVFISSGSYLCGRTIDLTSPTVTYIEEEPEQNLFIVCNNYIYKYL